MGEFLVLLIYFIIIGECELAFAFAFVFAFDVITHEQQRMVYMCYDVLMLLPLHPPGECGLCSKTSACGEVLDLSFTEVSSIAHRVFLMIPTM